MHAWVGKIRIWYIIIELPHLPVLASTAYKVSDSVRWQWPSTVYGLSLCRHQLSLLNKWLSPIIKAVQVSMLTL